MSASSSPALRGVVEEIEALAAIEHEQWMAWAATLMERESLSPERVARWKACMVPYGELSEEMKEHDRVWARKVQSALSQPQPQPGAAGYERKTTDEQRSEIEDGLRSRTIEALGEAPIRYHREAGPMDSGEEDFNPSLLNVLADLRAAESALAAAQAEVARVTAERETLSYNFVRAVNERDDARAEVARLEREIKELRK